MKVKATIILIHMNVTTTVPKQVFPWEVSVYEEKYTEGAIEEYESMIVDLDELPDAGEEFARMHRVCGTNDETNVPHVDNAYGRGKAGIAELKKAIAKAVVKPKKAKAPGKKAKAEKISDSRDPLA